MNTRSQNTDNPPGSELNPDIGSAEIVKKTLLVAEDVEADFLLIQSLLGKSYHLIHAWNGIEAVTLFEKSKPDLVLIMSVEPEICRENILKKAKRKYTGQEVMDQAEANFNHQMETAKEYEKMAQKEPDRWLIIDCCRDGKLLPKEEIHEIIWNKLKELGFLKINIV